MWFVSLTNLCLFVKVGGQLNQPGRLDSSHVTHVIFGRLHHFIEDNPSKKKKNVWQALSLHDWTHILLEYRA